jgi:WD40 repeat protein
MVFPSGVNLSRRDEVDSIVAWPPGGKWLASDSYEGAVRVWDATAGVPLLTYREHTGAVNSVVWSPDGKRLAAGSWVTA